MNIIGRDALLPEDFRKLTPEELAKVLPSFIFYKAKDLLPSELKEDDSRELTWTTVQSKRDKKEEEEGES